MAFLALNDSMITTVANPAASSTYTVRVSDGIKKNGFYDCLLYTFALIPKTN